MATRIEDILTKIRDPLADPNKERWSDAQLIRLIDEAHKDIATHAKILKGEYAVTLTEGQAKYDLPDDIWEILRATYNDTVIDFFSYNSLDELVEKLSLTSYYTNFQQSRHQSEYSYNQINYDWENDEASTISAIVYDNRNISELRVYPKPSSGIADNDYTFTNSGYLEPTIYITDSPYGVLSGVPTEDELVDELGVVIDADSEYYLITDINSCSGLTTVEDADLSSVYGVVGNIEDTLRIVGFVGEDLLGVCVGIDDYSIDSVYGVCTDLYDPNIEKESFDSVYGMLTGVNESSSQLKIQYVKVPEDITTVNDTLLTHKMFDKAIKYYVAGMALHNDIEEQYVALGSKFLKLYERELEVAEDTSSRDSVMNPNALTTSYRSGFES